MSDDKLIENSSKPTKTEYKHLEVDINHEDSTREYEEDNENIVIAKQENNKTITKFIIIGLLLIVILIIVIIVFIIVKPTNKNNESKESKIINECVNDRYLLLISLDGFSHEYIANQEWREKYNVSLPNIESLINQGTYIKRVIPVFPSFTFPNHLSIITGLYPGHHGIIANSFYDKQLNETFARSILDTTGKWYKGIPIWQTMKSEDNINKFKDYKYSNKKAGAVFWPGTEHNISGNGFIDYYMKYNHSFEYINRINKLVTLLQTKEYRLLIGYFDQPDSNGHKYGPDSIEVSNSVKEMDNYVGILIDKIKNLDGNFWEKTDIIFVSGMLFI